MRGALDQAGRSLPESTETLLSPPQRGLLPTPPLLLPAASSPPLQASFQGQWLLQLPTEPPTFLFRATPASHN